jgi:hypothetical protein
MYAAATVAIKTDSDTFLPQNARKAALFGCAYAEPVTCYECERFFERD